MQRRSLASGIGDKAPFEGRCSVCGAHGCFTAGALVEQSHVSLAGGYACPTCGAVLKYQGQADVILREHAIGARSLAELVDEPGFALIDVYEPGRRGPLRPYLQKLPGYVRSMYLPDQPTGELIDGVSCEDLMALSFASESFDLVITTDVFEHVRHPDVAFAEVFRVLREGGLHVFTVPGLYWRAPDTVRRVDVSGDEDVMLLEPVYHDGTELVYNDFGAADLLYLLAAVGFETDPVPFDLPDHPASLQVTYRARKPTSA